jgi:hypothetical protein
MKLVHALKMNPFRPTRIHFLVTTPARLEVSRTGRDANHCPILAQPRRYTVLKQHVSINVWTMSGKGMMLTIVSSDECVSISVGNYAVHMLLRLLHRDVHIAIKTRENTYDGNH